MPGRSDGSRARARASAVRTRGQRLSPGPNSVRKTGPPFGAPRAGASLGPQAGCTAAVRAEAAPTRTPRSPALSPARPGPAHTGNPAAGPQPAGERGSALRGDAAMADNARHPRGSARPTAAALRRAAATPPARGRARSPPRCQAGRWPFGGSAPAARDRDRAALALLLPPAAEGQRPAGACSASRTQPRGGGGAALPCGRAGAAAAGGGSGCQGAGGVLCGASSHEAVEAPCRGGALRPPGPRQR